MIPLSLHYNASPGSLPLSLHYIASPGRCSRVRGSAPFLGSALSSDGVRSCSHGPEGRLRGLRSGSTPFPPSAYKNLNIGSRTFGGGRVVTHGSMLCAFLFLRRRRFFCFGWLSRADRAHDPLRGFLSLRSIAPRRFPSGCDETCTSAAPLALRVLLP